LKSAVRTGAAAGGADRVRSVEKRPFVNGHCRDICRGRNERSEGRCPDDLTEQEVIVMPRGDGTGPQGQGPGAGKGKGKCRRNSGDPAGRPSRGKGAGKGKGGGMGQATGSGKTGRGQGSGRQDQNG